MLRYKGNSNWPLLDWWTALSSFLETSFRPPNCLYSVPIMHTICVLLNLEINHKTYSYYTTLKVKKIFSIWDMPKVLLLAVCHLKQCYCNRLRLYVLSRDHDLSLMSRTRPITTRQLLAWRGAFPRRPSGSWGACTSPRSPSSGSPRWGRRGGASGSPPQSCRSGSPSAHRCWCCVCGSSLVWRLHPI